MIQIQPGAAAQRYATHAEAVDAVLAFANSGRALDRFAALVMEDLGSFGAIVCTRESMLERLPFGTRKVKKRLRQRDRSTELLTFIVADGQLVEHIVKAGEEPRGAA